jgi:hypothetical protein
MRRGRKRILKWSIGLLVAAATTLYVVTMSTPFPTVHVPVVDVLAKYPRNGDGVSDMTHATITLHYFNLKTDEKLRQQIHDELTRKGFKPRISSQGTSYTKSTGWLFPDRSYVMVLNDGKVFAGTAHSKWPRF